MKGGKEGLGQASKKRGRSTCIHETYCKSFVVFQHIDTVSLLTRCAVFEGGRECGVREKERKQRKEFWGEDLEATLRMPITERNETSCGDEGSGERGEDIFSKESRFQGKRNYWLKGHGARGGDASTKQGKPTRRDEFSSRGHQRIRGGRGIGEKKKGEDLACPQQQRNVVPIDFAGESFSGREGKVSKPENQKKRGGFLGKRKKHC